MGSRQVRLNATLKDSGNNPIANKTIQFFYRTSGATTWTSAGTATTNSSGVASVTVTVTTPGTYDFRAYFAGDDQYESTISLTVTPL